MKPRDVDRKVFDDLAATQGETLISIVLPTHKRGPELEQDRIMLKNLISAAEQKLESAGWKPRDRTRRLEEARRLLDEDEFWRYQRQGLAIYIDDDRKADPIALSAHSGAALTTISDVYHVRYLIPSLELSRLRVLALAKGGVALYECGLQSIARLEADLPSSIDDVNWFMDREAQLQRHTERPGTSQAMHGHDPRDRLEEDLSRFLREVSRALPRQPGNGPLVVVGEDVLVGRFASVHGEEIVHPENSGTWDVEDAPRLHERVKPVIVAEEKKLMNEAAASANGSLDRGKAVTDLPAAISAAITGRLSDVVVARTAQPVWGSYDAASLEVEEAGEVNAVGDTDLLDRLLVEATHTGAVVRTVDEPINGYDFVATKRF